MFGTGGKGVSKRKTLTHKQRMALIYTPIVLLNHRICHSVKRWGGVFVNDNFGEHESKRRHNRRRSPILEYDMDLTAVSEPLTGYDKTFHLEDHKMWERVSVKSHGEFIK